MNKPLPEIVRVIGQYLPLQQNEPGEWVASCPFHHDPTRGGSFGISEVANTWKCAACGRHGTAAEFVKQYETPDQ